MRKQRNLKPRDEEDDDYTASADDVLDDVAPVTQPPVKPTTRSTVADDIDLDFDVKPLPAEPVRPKVTAGRRGAGQRGKTKDNEVVDHSPTKASSRPALVSMLHRSSMAMGPERKLTRKQKSDLATAKQSGKQRCGLIRGMQAYKRKQFSHSSVLVGRDTDSLVIGVPIPALSFEFLIKNSVLPLSIVLHLIAKWSTGKSGMVAEFMRWFIAADGIGVLEENETKFSPEWYRSIIGQEDYDELVQFDRCASVEDWQEKLTVSMDYLKSEMDGTRANPGPGRTTPVIFAVDSIMGKLTRASQASIEDEGSSGGRAFPVEAASIARYMKTMPAWLDGWPFTVVLVNHLKDRRDSQGNDIRAWAGGEHIGFQETLEIEMKKVGRDIDCAEFDGFNVEMKCIKNSLGGGKRKITTRVIWWEDEIVAKDGTKSFEQRTVWDWPWSTVKLLNQLMHGDGASPRLRNNLKESGFHLDCPKVSDVENLAWSKTLGMKKDDAAPWHVVGEMIQNNQEVLQRLRLALRIHDRPVLDGDYIKQLARRADEMD